MFLSFYLQLCFCESNFCNFVFVYRQEYNGFCVNKTRVCVCVCVCVSKNDVWEHTANTVVVLSSKKKREANGEDR